MRRSFTAVALTAVAALTAGLTVPKATAGASEPGPVEYVALGDSYSAASGVLPPDLSAPLQCLRSTLNYPHVMADQIGAHLTDVTCGAAQTKDYFESQHSGVAPQLDALSPTTELVTMTIGGNDSGVFINAIIQCGSAGILALGQGNPCEQAHGTSFEDTLTEVTYPALVEALEAVHDRAPNAEVLILGYPWIMPETDGCYPIMPVAKGDVPYLRRIQATLNDAVARAAAVTGSTYVDFSQVSNGHDACAPIGTRWIEPAVLTTNPVVVHPNALGEFEMARQAMAAMGRQDTSTTAALPGKKLVLRNNRQLKRLRVTCPATEVSGPCTGAVKVRTRKKVSFRGERKRVTLATVSYSVPAGTTDVLKVRVKKSKARLLRKSKRARKVVAIARTSDAAGNTAKVRKRKQMKVRR